jgi:hypothetical protein
LAGQKISFYIAGMGEGAEETGRGGKTMTKAEQQKSEY